MDNEFKRKLEAYENGELSDSELEDFEKELEKLESYQEFLEENSTQGMKDSIINETKQQKILRRSKWKARLQTAFSALGIILIFHHYFIISNCWVLFMGDTESCRCT